MLDRGKIRNYNEGEPKEDRGNASAESREIPGIPNRMRTLPKKAKPDTINERIAQDGRPQQPQRATNPLKGTVIFKEPKRQPPGATGNPKQDSRETAARSNKTVRRRAIY